MNPRPPVPHIVAQGRLPSEWWVPLKHGRRHSPSFSSVNLSWYSSISLYSSCLSSLSFSIYYLYIPFLASVPLPLLFLSPTFQEKHCSLLNSLLFSPFSYINISILPDLALGHFVFRILCACVAWYIL